MAPILGTRWRSRPLGGGTFHCPRCDRERDYTATGIGPVLAAFGRRLLRWGAEQTLVACDSCGAIYDVSITTVEPGRAREIRSEDELALEAVLSAAVFSDSTVREVEKQAARHAVRQYAHRAHDDVDSGPGAAAGARRRAPDPFQRLERLAGVLSEPAKRRILAAVYRVCAADRELHPQEARLVMKIGEMLELHPRHVREAMKEGRT